jgi:hypothetical protein
MTVGGTIYPLKTWARRIGELVGGCLLPTPVASEPGTNSKKKDQDGNWAKGVMSLATMARKNLWPTPTVADSKNGNSNSQSERNSPGLSSQVGGKLSPMFVEWLMNYPTGWTELDASVMQSYLHRPVKRSSD